MKERDDRDTTTSTSEDPDDPLARARRIGLAEELRALEDRSALEIDVAPRGGPPRRKDLVVLPDRLGRRYLEDATQQPEEIEELDETEREGTGDLPLATLGERYMRGQSPEASDAADRLVTRMPDRSEHEARISRLARATHGKKSD